MNKHRQKWKKKIYKQEEMTSALVVIPEYTSPEMKENAMNKSK